MISLGQFRFGPNHILCLYCRADLHRDMFDGVPEFETGKLEFYMTHKHKCLEKKDGKS